MTSRGEDHDGRGWRRAPTELRTRARTSWDRHATTTGWAAFTTASYVAFGFAGLVGGLVMWAVHLRWNPGPDVVAVGSGLVLALAGVTWLGAGVPEPPDVYAVTQRDVPSLLAVIGVVGLVVAAWRGAARDMTGPRRDLDHAVTRAGHLLRHAVRPLERADAPVTPALLEAVAITVVVGAHTLPSVLGPTDLVDRWLADAVWFAVPALVFAAGQRAARHQGTPGWTRRRLEGLLVPYVLVSVLAIGLRSWSDAFPPIEDPIADLLLGATLAPYHLVLTLLVLTLVTPWLLRLRGVPAVVVLAASVLAQAGTQAFAEPEFWRLRNPLLWLGFYMAGVLAWRQRARVGRWSVAWPGVMFAWSLAVTVVLVLPSAAAGRDLATLAAAWLMVAALELLGGSLAKLPRVVWGIAGNAYLLYLLHVPFVVAVTGAAGTPAPSVRTFAGWSIGLAGATSVVIIARHATGRAATDSLGA